jgi:hypothetical protein
MSFEIIINSFFVQRPNLSSEWEIFELKKKLKNIEIWDECTSTVHVCDL